MSKLQEKFPFDFSPNGGTIHDLGDSYTKETKRIYDLLNDIRENNEGTTEPQPKQLMISENGKIYIRSLDNDRWVHIGDYDNTNGIPILNANITGSASKFGAVPINTIDLKDGDVFIYDAINNQFTNKRVPVIDEKTGAINVNSTGSVAKLINIPIVTEAIEDGQILVYRPALGGFVNESKASIGAGRALNLLINDTPFVDYSGTETKNVRLVATTEEEPIDDNVRTKSVVWLKPV
jgi:hypothetical protein